MSVSTSAAFIDLLTESNLLSSEDLARAEELIADEQDTRKAARNLVKADLLTRWQASQLLRGSPLLSLGKYVLLERLPWGSNHAVFLAKHPMMDRMVALNVLDRASSGRSDSRESFISDARAIATLDHRNLIHVYDIDEAEERWFLVMEYVDGRNLHDAIKEQGKMSVEVAADAIRQIADGLAQAHDKKLIHGGLRPTNIILDEDGTVKVIDLGLSKFDDLSKRPSGKDGDSKIISIADFLSPEQAQGKWPTSASDIYSLGCIAYFILTGEAPFTGGSYTQRLQRHQHNQVPNVRKTRSDVPEGLANIVTKMMAKESSQRYGSTKEIVSDLEKWWADYSATLAANKPKPKPVAAPKKTSSKGQSQTGSKPPVAAAPPPKKNGNSANPSAAQTKGGFPGVQTDAQSKSPAAAAPTVAAAATKSTKPKQTTAKPTESKKKPAGSDAKPSPEKSDKPSVEKKGLPLPLILGAAGLVVLLLVGGGVGLAAYFLLSPSGEPANVAVVEDESQQLDDESSKASETDETATNEEPTDGEEDPQPPDVEDPQPPNEEEPGDGSGSDPEVPPEGEPEPSDPDPPKDPDPPTDPPKKPNPPKDPPKNGGGTKPPKKPPKPKNPFREFATAIELPPLSGDAQVTSLGKVHLPENVACYIDLLGGEKVVPEEDSAFALERARNGLAEREWEFKLEEEGNSTVVATMKLEAADLQFQWTPEASKREATPYLCNCALNLRTADDEIYLALRKPEQINALVVNLERPTLRQKVEISQAPDMDTLSFEVTKIDGIEKVTYQPKQILQLEKDSTIVWVGEGGEHLLGFQLDTVTQRDLQLKMTVVVDGGAKPVAFNGKQLAQFYQQAQFITTQLGPQVEKMKKKRDQFRRELPAAEQKLSIATQTLEKLEALKKQAEAANGATMHFRVFRAAGNHNIDLIQGTIVPEAAVKAE